MAVNYTSLTNIDETNQTISVRNVKKVTLQGIEECSAIETMGFLKKLMEEYPKFNVISTFATCKAIGDTSYSELDMAHELLGFTRLWKRQMKQVGGSSAQEADKWEVCCEWVLRRQ